MGKLMGVGQLFEGRHFDREVKVATLRLVPDAHLPSAWRILPFHPASGALLQASEAITPMPTLCSSASG